LLGGQDVVATLFVLTGELPSPSLVSLLRSALGACPAVLAGATELPDRSGAAVRILGTSSAAVRAALTSAWGAARRWILGAPPPDMRKG
jgi:urease accessory protein